MSADVYQSVDPQGASTDVPGHTEGAQAGGPTISSLRGTVGCESGLLSQKMGTSGAETELPLPLGAQMSEKKSGVLLRVQREETGFGKTDLSDL